MVCAVHQTLPFFCESGSGLQDYTIHVDRDKERDSKQQKIVEKTNTRRLSVLPVYNVSCVNACVQLHLTLIFLVL